MRKKGSDNLYRKPEIRDVGDSHLNDVAAVDGISLTVVGLSDTQFTIAVIPYTYEHTTLGSRQPGDKVNLEADILAKYTERLLKEGLGEAQSSSEQE